MTGTSRIGSTRGIIFFLIVGAAVFCLPHLVRAQTAPPSDLRATIRAELLSDPRTSSLTSAQLNAMVDLLSQQAQKQGLSASDIEWHPTPPAPSDTTVVPAATCNGSFTCEIDQAFGFVGSDTTIPFVLGAASMGLIWSIAEILHRRKYPHLFAPPAATPGM